MRSATILAIALAGIAFTGCGGPSRLKPKGTPSASMALQEALVTAKTKQDVIVTVGSGAYAGVQTSDEHDKISERLRSWAAADDRTAAKIAADLRDGSKSMKYGIWLTTDQLAEFEARWNALPYRSEIAAQEATATAEAKAKADAAAAEKAKVETEAKARATYVSLPIIDTRAAIAALLQSGTSAPATSGGWKPVTLAPAGFDAVPVSISDDLTGLYVSADKKHLVAYGPKAMLVSHDGGESWTRRAVGVRQAIAADSGRVIALSVDGALISGEGFVLSEDLPRIYSMTVGWGRLLVATKSTIQWLDIRGTDVVVAGKAPRPVDTVLAGATKDGAAIVVGRGCIPAAILPGGAAGRVPALVGAARAAVAKPAPDHAPTWITPETTSAGEGGYCVDGAYYAAAPGGPASYLRPGDLLMSSGTVQFVVDAAGVADINDWSGPDQKSYGRSKASAGLPQGTRAVEPAGAVLFAVGKHGLYRHPRW